MTLFCVGVALEADVDVDVEAISESSLELAS